MTVWLSLLVAIIGLLVYELASNPKVSELGRISYFAGLLALLLQAAQVVTVLHR